MKLSPRLQLRQAQALVMTPQLQQAIKLLQLSNLEVAAYVESELEENPLLERDESDEERDEQASEDGAAEARRDGEPPLLEPIAPRDANQAQGEAPLDVEPNGDDWSGSSAADWRSGSRGGDFDDREDVFEQSVARATTLREHLLEQIGIDLIQPVDRIIGAHLVDLLDEAGYLPNDLSLVATTLDCPPERIEETLKRLQRFDPPGVFARSLQECLVLQLADRGRLDKAMSRLLDHLDLLAKREMGELARACGVDAATLARLIAEVKTCDPKPGLAFDVAPAQPVIPDVLMRPAQGGGWQVELNHDTLPRVLVNQRYYTIVVRHARSKAERDFLAERLQSANWLVRSLHQRAQTILKVASELVRQQDAFFRHGVRRLRPLVLRDIAAAIEMHESTVSRVTTNKYLACPHGIYELKYFFTSSIGGVDGSAEHSAEAVRSRIKKMIDTEPPSDVWSDDRIVAELRREGVDIARRTVAKYRETMRSPSSVQRRREKQIGF